MSGSGGYAADEAHVSHPSLKQTHGARHPASLGGSNRGCAGCHSATIARKPRQLSAWRGAGATRIAASEEGATWQEARRRMRPPSIIVGTPECCGSDSDCYPTASCAGMQCHPQALAAPPRPRCCMRSASSDRHICVNARFMSIFTIIWRCQCTCSCCHLSWPGRQCWRRRPAAIAYGGQAVHGACTHSRRPTRQPSHSGHCCRA